MRIYGASYTADLHCVECTEKTFDDDIYELADNRPYVVDSEGNTLYFLHSFDLIAHNGAMIAKD